MDFVAKFPISERLTQPLRAVLRGEQSDWPDELTAEEGQALIEHGIAPLVYAATHAPSLRGEAIRAAAFEPLRAADLTVVLEALASRGVEALVIKGSALAYEVYASPDLRPRGDTDILIARKDVDASRAALLELGLKETIGSGDEHAVRQMIFTRANGLTYDVHWSVSNLALFQSLLAYDDLRTRAVALPPLGPHARGLARADALLLACIHRVAHHHDSDRLIWLADIAYLRERMSPEEHRAFWRNAAAGKVVTVCTRSIELADAWFAPAPQDRAEEYLTQEELMQDEPSRVMLDREITYARVLAANFRALPWPARIARLRQLAFPPEAFMRTSFRSNAPLPWLYLRRALRGVTKLFRRAR
ncbi:MAG: nucleotidyltransferase family protein [Acidobacteriota bacterium]|nr:nucleotidyltransferase family protein [Acidobacteriota bacterium]